MTDIPAAAIAREGLWHNNPALVQLLGLCPLLAVTTSLVNGLGLALATTLVLALSNVTVSAIRRTLRPEVRIAVFVLIIASFVTTVELVMSALFHDLHRALGIFIPLIVTNCAIIGRAEAFASRHTVGRALLDALSMGAGFGLVLVSLGGLREVLAHGTLFAQAEMLLGPAAETWTLHLLGDYRGFLLAALPPGAFIGLGLLIALRNSLGRDRKRTTLGRSDLLGTLTDGGAAS